MSSSVVPSACSSRMKSHTSMRLRGSRPGRRLVEEQDVGPADEARGEVEAPAHAARVGLGGATRGLGQAEPLEHLAAAAARLGLRQVVEAPDQLEVLEPGEVLVDRGALAGEPDAEPQLLRVAHDVEAVDLGAAARRAASSVVRMRTAVVLPAPFGPSRPSTVPFWTSRSTPLSASTSPKCFTSCSVRMMGEHGRQVTDSNRERLADATERLCGFLPSSDGHVPRRMVLQPFRWSDKSGMLVIGITSGE